MELPQQQILPHQQYAASDAAVSLRYQPSVCTYYVVEITSLHSPPWMLHSRLKRVQASRGSAGPSNSSCLLHLIGHLLGLLLLQLL